MPLEPHSRDNPTWPRHKLHWTSSFDKPIKPAYVKIDSNLVGECLEFRMVAKPEGYIYLRTFIA